MDKTLVIIPTYNESENLPPLVHEIRRTTNFHILVVDDNSPDGTGRIAKELAEKLGQITVIERKGERGYGRACLVGFKYGLRQNFEYLIQMDADLSHNPKSLPEIFKKMSQSDIVIGSRYIEGGKIVVNWGFLRKLLSRGGNRFARLMLSLPVRDCTNGYRGYRREVIQNLNLDKIKSNGYSFLIEVLYESHKKGYLLAEVPT